MNPELIITGLILIIISSKIIITGTEIRLNINFKINQIKERF